MLPYVSGRFVNADPSMSASVVTAELVGRWIDDLSSPELLLPPLRTRLCCGELVEPKSLGLSA